MVAPTDAQAPREHVVGMLTKPSSVAPLQLLSTPSQPVSVAAGVPDVHVSITVPSTQDRVPVEAHAPIPQVVGADT
jgi:hypothetical protein